MVRNPTPPSKSSGHSPPVDVRRYLTSDAGFTLVEELVTIAVIAIGLIVLVAMVTTAVIGVNNVDRKVIGTNLARSQLELIKNAPYQPDPTAIPYPVVGSPANYTVTIGVEYWTAPSGPFTPTVRNDGLQKITVTVDYDGSQVELVEGYKVAR
jgi:type II secretory pathway pseudopilin PulG